MINQQHDYVNWSQEEKDAFRRANRIKAKYRFSKDTMSKQPYLILIFGLAVFVLSSEKVNQNTVFSYFTFLQGITLIPFYMLQKRTGQIEHLLNAFIGYMLIWIAEMVLFGFPNELLAAYNTVKITGGQMIRPRVEFLNRPENDHRSVYPIFPYVYSMIKLSFGVLSFTTFRNYYRWVKLPDSMKEKVF
jgi:hypothetical protein